MSNEEQRMLKELADREGLTISDTLRQQVRRAHEERVYQAGVRFDAR